MKIIHQGLNRQQAVDDLQFPDGTVKFSKFYDEKLYDQAVKEYIDFVEKLTGKKVLVGCKSRMNWAISGLGILNNPKAYKDVDYILIGHGKNSSLITDITHPNTWRFSDNDKSIYEFIEQNVPKGKKVMVTCCETQGVNKAIEATKNNTGLTLNIAFNYGGRPEIVRAVKQIAEKLGYTVKEEKDEEIIKQL